jgi:mercuric ion transport protein
LIWLGVVGTVLAVLCCATPVMARLLGASGSGLSALTGYPDYALLPALVLFVGITVCALWKRQRAQACCIPSHKAQQ